MTTPLDLSKATLDQIASILNGAEYPVYLSSFGSPILNIPAVLPGKSLQNHSIPTCEQLECNLHALAGRVIELGKSLKMGSESSQTYMLVTNPQMKTYYQVLKRIQQLYERLSETLKQGSSFSSITSSIQSLGFSRESQIAEEIKHLGLMQSKYHVDYSSND